MKQLRQMILWTGTVVLILAFFAGGSLAQRPDHPDANPTTEVGGEGGGGDAGLVTTTGMVHGYVLDYSNGAAPQAGIPVILDGGGWQAEALTNSEGYYRFAGLGAGSATLELKLPAGTQAAAPHWKVLTGNPQPAYTNLGFYWGDANSLPVVLSAQMDSADAAQLIISVKNQSGGQASGVQVDLTIPEEVLVVSAAGSAGSVDSSGHQVWAELGDLPTGQTATVTVKLAFATNATAWAKLVYREQLTPLQFALNLIAPPPSGVKAEVAAQSRSAGTQEVAAATVAPAESKEAVVATATPAEIKEATAAPAQESQAVVAATSAPAQSQSDELVPTTGKNANKTAVNWPGIVFLLVFIVGLGAAGVSTLARRRV